MNRQFLTSTLHILFKIQKMFLMSKSSLLTVEIKIQMTNKLIFSDKLSLHQWNFFHLSNISWRPVALSGDFVPVDWFLHTRSLGIKIHGVTFLRKFVTIKGEILPLELFTQTSCLFSLIKVFFYHSRFSYEKIAWQFLLCQRFCLIQRLLRWHNKNDFVPTLEAMQKWLLFTTTRISI